MLSPNTLAFWNSRSLRPHYPQLRCHSQATLGPPGLAECPRRVPAPWEPKRPPAGGTGASCLLVPGSSAHPPPAHVWNHTSDHTTPRGSNSGTPRVRQGGWPPNQTLHARRLGLEGGMVTEECRAHLPCGPCEGSVPRSGSSPSPPHTSTPAISPAGLCSFYTFNLNAPSSVKASLTAPQPSEAGAGVW